MDSKTKHRIWRIGSLPKPVHRNEDYERTSRNDTATISIASNKQAFRSGKLVVRLQTSNLPASDRKT